MGRLLTDLASMEIGLIYTENKAVFEPQIC